MGFVVSEMEAEFYRSLRVRFPAERLTVFQGANGVGKTNLYRALQLMQAAAAGTLARELAAEGGMASVLWAGPRSARTPARMRLAVTLSPSEPAPGRFHYEVEIGMKAPVEAALPLEPLIKQERVTFLGQRRPVMLLDRRGPAITVTMRRASARSPKST